MVTAVVLVGLVLFFALLLLTAAASKIALGSDFAFRLRSQGVPANLAPLVARSVIAAEVAVSICLASSMDPRLSFSALAALMAVFLGYRVWLLLRGSQTGCTCFGVDDPRRSNGTDVVASVYVIGALLGLALSFDPGHYYASSARWIVLAVVLLLAAGLARGAYASRRGKATGDGVRL